MSGTDAESESPFFHFSLFSPSAEFTLRGDWTLQNIAAIEGSPEHLGLQALPIYSSHKAELDEWATTHAIHAISTAYRDVFLDIRVGLKRSDM